MLPCLKSLDGGLTWVACSTPTDQWWADIGVPLLVGLATLVLAVASVVVATMSWRTAERSVLAAHRSAEAEEHANAIAKAHFDQMQVEKDRDARATIASRLEGWFLGQLLDVGRGTYLTADRTEESIALQEKLSSSGLPTTREVYQDLLCLLYEATAVSGTDSWFFALNEKRGLAHDWVTSWGADPAKYVPKTEEGRRNSAMLGAAEAMMKSRDEDAGTQGSLGRS